MQLITLLNTHTHTNNSLCLKMCMWRNAGKKVYYIYIMGVWSLCICVVFWGMHAVFLVGGCWVGIYACLTHETNESVDLVLLLHAFFFFIVFVLLAFYSKLFNLFLSLFLILQHLWAFFLVLPFEWMNQSNSVLDGFELWGLLWVVILNKISCG